ncbi:acyl-CoA dehydrogenase family protein [Sphingomonas sp. RP10(2022)]|uniref:Acyl-CoA dehydrogenase family protein n=1 Tax=Sphingomonas liriopis TaxID=2949094 RepID=A0A9X2KNB6_9SPHN|nr:acyl-CoA dehydrogenase family protein [Sphingomonas liriopis]MCP3733479.1 acyl-CoA dehydrogenase family protein [Sphingomonas liriopis]
MQELIEPFARLLEDLCPPSVVRAIEAGGDWRPLWQGIVDSGYLDALVPEEAGGAGLALNEAAPLVGLLGRHVVPLPVGDTMVARALLARAGTAWSDEPIALATGASFAATPPVAAQMLVGTPDEPRLVGAEALADPAERAPLRPLAAVLRAQQIAGAGARVLEMSVAYANDRVQFGKPIGRQQALQQQLAVLAEQAVAARLAAAIGVRGGLPPAPRDAAIAKHGASLAAAEIAGIAHAIHGAIGISEEYDLQLLTRSLHAWRLADGGAGYWAAELGRERAATPAAALDWLLAPAEV